MFNVILGLDISTSKIGLSIMDYDMNLLYCQALKLSPKEDLEERITSRIARGFSLPNEEMKGKLMDAFQGILKKHNLTAQEFGSLYLAEISEAGRTLGVQSRISKAQTK